MAKIDLTEYLEKLEEPEDREAVANREVLLSGETTFRSSVRHSCGTTAPGKS